jgi:hypothetical protein
VSELHLPTSQASLAKLRSLCLTDDIDISNVDPDHPMSAGLQKEFGRKADPRRGTGESMFLMLLDMAGISQVISLRLKMGESDA